MTWAVFVGSLLALNATRVEVAEMKRYAPRFGWTRTPPGQPVSLGSTEGQGSLKPTQDERPSRAWIKRRSPAELRRCRVLTRSAVRVRVGRSRRRRGQCRRAPAYGQIATAGGLNPDTDGDAAPGRESDE